jgi:hypothetical protein
MSGFSQERKRSKKKEHAEGEACGKLPQPVEIDKGGLRQLFLDDFQRCLKKTCAKNRSGLFSQFRTGPTAIKLTIGD